MNTIDLTAIKLSIMQAAEDYANAKAYMERHVGYNINDYRYQRALKVHQDAFHALHSAVSQLDQFKGE